MIAESSYLYLSLQDAIEIYAGQMDVFLSEQATNQRIAWWSPDWFPVGDNGLGDLLVVHCGEGQRQGNVLRFNHETRRTKTRAKSFVALLQEIATGIVDGKYEYSNNDKCIV